MTIKTLFFGITSDLVQASSLEIPFKDGQSIKEFKAILRIEFPQLKNINSYAVAVNEAYASDDIILKANDVVAIIPPVSGG